MRRYGFVYFILCLIGVLPPSLTSAQPALATTPLLDRAIDLASGSRGQGPVVVSSISSRGMRGLHGGKSPRHRMTVEASSL